MVIPAGPTQGGNDAFVALYNDNGFLQWAAQLGTTSYDRSLEVSADNFGNASITGYTHGDLEAQNAENRDVFVSKFDISGELLWTQQLGTSATEESLDIALDACGNAYFTGWTGGELGGPNPDGQDVFVAKLFVPPSCELVNLDGVGLIDLRDQALFAPEWSADIPGSIGDFTCDNQVEVKDLFWLAKYWLQDCNQ